MSKNLQSKTRALITALSLSSLSIISNASPLPNYYLDTGVLDFDKQKAQTKTNSSFKESDYHLLKLEGNVNYQQELASTVTAPIEDNHKRQTFNKEKENYLFYHLRPSLRLFKNYKDSLVNSTYLTLSNNFIKNNSYKSLSYLGEAYVGSKLFNAISIEAGRKEDLFNKYITGVSLKLYNKTETTTITLFKKNVDDFYQKVYYFNKDNRSKHKAYLNLQGNIDTEVAGVDMRTVHHHSHGNFIVSWQFGHKMSKKPRVYSYDRSGETASIKVTNQLTESKLLVSYDWNFTSWKILTQISIENITGSVLIPDIYDNYFTYEIGYLTNIGYFKNFATISTVSADYLKFRAILGITYKKPKYKVGFIYNQDRLKGDDKFQNQDRGGLSDNSYRFKLFYLYKVYPGIDLYSSVTYIKQNSDITNYATDTEENYFGSIDQKLVRYRMTNKSIDINLGLRINY